MTPHTGAHDPATMTIASTSAVTIAQAKRALRKTMRATLASLDSDNVGMQSRDITEHVTRQKAFADARRVSVYVSMAKGEARTEDLCRRVLEEGKQLYVPRFAVDANAATSSLSGSDPVPRAGATFDTDMRMLRVFDWSDYDAMVLNRWGIREPAEDAGNRRREDALLDATGGTGLDLIIVPGVAFDEWGGRLGHGKGYYDRYIAKAAEFARKHGQAPPSTIALALREQILPHPEHVPTDANDERLDGIVAQDGPMRYRSNV